MIGTQTSTSLIFLSRKAPAKEEEEDDFNLDDDFSDFDLFGKGGKSGFDDDDDDDF